MKMSKLITKLTSGLTLCTMLAYTMPVLAYTKEEKVYTKLDTTGTPYETIVSTHIKNEDGEKLLNDLSDLINIENVGGDESFEQDGDSLVWDAEGSDIYYEGESQKELPIDVNITYELDGKMTSAKELAGKDGHLKITIDYTNKDSHIVKVNGRNETLYTPFVVVSGAIVENDKAKNVEISSGKVQDNGDKTIIVGFALPGLQESLNLKKADMDIPSSVEIEMDVTDFELSGIATYVTPKILEEDDLDIFDDLDDIYGKVNDLQDATNKLKEGADTLNNGTSEYASKSKEFNSAMVKISDGVTTVNNNYSKIDSAIGTLSSSSTTLEQGAQSLAVGAGAISDNLQNVSAGAAGINAGLGTVKSTANQMSAGASQILTSLDGVGTDNSAQIAGLQTLSGANHDAATSLSAVPDMSAAGASAQAGAASAQSKLANAQAGLDAANAAGDANAIALYTELVGAYTELAGAYGTAASACAAAGATAGVVGLLNQNETALNGIVGGLQATDTSGIAALKAGIAQLKAGADGIANASDLYNGAASLAAGSATLAEKSTELVSGANQLYAGTQALSNGTKELDTGSKQLKSGLNTLDSSTVQLRDANGQLTNAASTISDGVNTLAEGITKYKEEGIDEICNYINGDLKSIQTRVEKLQDLANEYSTFTMLNNGESGSVNFIMIMDAIKKEDSNKEEAIVEENKSEVVEEAKEDKR